MTTGSTGGKKLLYEVSIIRPIIISLLVFLHSFNKIANGGGYSNDYQLCMAYKWLLYLIQGFRIEMIALVAGYVFAYQCIDLKRSYEFVPFVKKKFKRLIIPMLFFGLIYYCCFYLNLNSFSVTDFVVKLFSGCGHLWFLPMLFWCFIAIWAIDHFNLSSWKLLCALGVLAICPNLSIPFGLGRLPHFLFFVYSGYYLWTKHNWIFEHWLNVKTIIVFWTIYVVIVVLRQTFLPDYHNANGLVIKYGLYAFQSFVGLFASCVGVIALYVTVCRITARPEYKPKQWVISASDNCYGLYVFHQFILVFLYFKTPLVGIMNPLLVPWVGFFVTYPLSLLLTKLTLKTKFGRYLIG